ncbi:sensor histidine kinase [Candidatus Margulisiibacteriota bacterium]
MQFAQIAEKQKIFALYARFRWAVIILILLTILHLRFIANFDIPLLPALLVLGLGGIFNLIFMFVSPRLNIERARNLSLYLAGSLDFILLSALIHLSGGVESPFTLIYFISLVAATIFGFIGLAYFLAIEAALLYSGVCLLEAFSILPHYRLSDPCGTLFLDINYIFSVTFAFFVTALLLIAMTSYLARVLTQKQEQIKELTNAQVSFMNQIMHETKSPLTSIIGYTEILLKKSFGALTKEQESSLQVIQRQSERILNLSNNLLDLARLEAGAVKIDKTPVALAELIERAIEEMKPLLDEKDLEIITELDPHLPAVPMDEGKIFEVLINLLSNAAKFSRNKGKIFISTQALDKHIQVSVRDEGIGIDPEDLPHIFEKFHRATSKEAAEVRGTGLGLALSKRIVEAHGGRLWAVSGGRGKGAVFHFTLPL